MGLLPPTSLGPEYHSTYSMGNPEKKNLINNADYQVQWNENGLKISLVVSIMEMVTWIT